MAGADVIDDRLPVRTLRSRVTHHPVPQIRILHVEHLVERLPLRFVRAGEALVQPAAEQGVQFARTAAGAPAQALVAGLIHH
jgi:hypothetical protein